MGITESPIDIANKILKDRQAQQCGCEESKCGKVFGSHAQMYYHWVTTHTMGTDTQTKGIMVTDTLSFEDDGDKENQNTNLVNDKEFTVLKKSQESGVVQKLKPDEQRAHRKLIHGSGSSSTTPEPREQPQTEP